MSIVNSSNAKWEAHDVNGGKWWASNEGYKFIWIYDSGTGDREKAGGGMLLARHFFKTKHQVRFLKIFGNEQFLEINETLKTEYDLYLFDPNAYNKTVNNRQQAGWTAAAQPPIT